MTGAMEVVVVLFVVVGAVSTLTLAGCLAWVVFVSARGVRRDRVCERERRMVAAAASPEALQAHFDLPAREPEGRVER